eukprot:365734-Chlamydomonas_euryale.AAC.25
MSAGRLPAAKCISFITSESTPATNLQDFPLMTTINAIVNGKLTPSDVTRDVQACKQLLTPEKKAAAPKKKIPTRAPLDLTMTV